MSFLIKYVLIEYVLVSLLAVYLDHDKNINAIMKRYFNNITSLIQETGKTLCFICFICIIYIVCLVLWGQNVSNTLNWWTVALNLAYSYIAGFIVYVLTVSYPAWKRRKRMKGIIQRMIFKLGVDIVVEFRKIGMRIDVLSIKHEDCYKIVKETYNKNSILFKQLLESLDRINAKCDSFLLSCKEYLSDDDFPKVADLKKVFIDSFLGMGDEKNELDNLDRVEVLVWICILRYRDLAIAFIPDLAFPDE